MASREGGRTGISGQASVLDTQAGPDIPGTLTQEHPGQPDSWESLRPQRGQNSCYHNHPLELSDSDDANCKFLAV
ncbi:hypothetical protein [Paenibacillus sp. FSL R5-0923]|uniref:Uncharacterized protein n=1 Tax=Paenibacillus odorifer TaxID=189426 RepID=A0ABX3HMW0_9BACL|nr:hypothetical protein BSK51_15740 [Paenibacillus odorifer]